MIVTDRIWRFWRSFERSHRRLRSVLGRGRPERHIAAHRHVVRRTANGATTTQARAAPADLV